MKKLLFHSFCTILFLLFVNNAMANRGKFDFALAVSSAGGYTLEGTEFDKAGNVLYVGSFHDSVTFGNTTLISSGGEDIFIAKYTGTGTFIWAKKAGGASGNDVATAVAIDSLNNIYITGNKYLAAIFDTITLSSNNIAGSSINGNIYPCNVFVAKYSSNGSIIFVKQFWGQTLHDDTFESGLVSYDYLNNSRGTAIDVSNLGVIFITGSFSGKLKFSNDTLIGNYEKTTFGTHKNFNQETYFTACLNTNGIRIWANKLPGYDLLTPGLTVWSKDKGTSISFSQSGLVYSAGYRIDHVTAGSGNSFNLFTGRYLECRNAITGTIIWSRPITTETTANTRYSRVKADNYGNVYFTSIMAADQTFFGYSFSSIVIAKFNSNGTVVAKSAYDPILPTTSDGFNNHDYLPLIKPDHIGNVYIAGLFRQYKESNYELMYDPTWGNKTYIAKYDSTLTFNSWGYQAGGNNTQYDTSVWEGIFPKAINLTNGKVQIAGKLNGAMKFDSIFINASSKAFLAQFDPTFIPAPTVVKPKKIFNAEYFFDIDSGVTKGNQVTIITPADSLTLNLTVSTLGLGHGFHRLYFRFRDSIGNWSNYENNLFYVYDTIRSLIQTFLPNKISKAEYFFDLDSGATKGKPVAILAPADSIALNLSISTLGLDHGFHRLYFRFRDSLGNWSNYENNLFYVFDTIRPIAQIISAKIKSLAYYFDTISGIPVIVSSPLADSITFNISINISSLSIGNHKIITQAKDSAGMVSYFEGRKFVVCSSILPTPILSSGNSYCPGDTIRLNGTPVAGANSYLWKGPNNFTSTGLNLQIPNASLVKAGNYTLVAIRVGGTACDTSNEASYTVTINNLPIVQSLSVIGTLNFCIGDSVILNTTNQTGFSYRWKRNGNNTTNASDTFNNLIVKSNGTYTVFVTNENGCSGLMRDTLIIVNPKPTTSIISGNNIVLINSTNAYNVTNTIGSTYNWLVNNGTINSGSSSNSISVTWSNLSGTGTVRVIEISNNGCKGDTISLSVSLSSYTLNINPMSLNYSNQAIAKQVNLSSNTSWTVSTNQTWVSLSKTSGNGNDSVNITLTANSNFVQRNATVTFTAGLLTQVVSITQDASIPDSLNLSLNTLHYLAAGSTQQVQLTSNRTWIASGYASWLTVTPNPGTGNTVLSITAIVNGSSNSRSTNITFTAGTLTKTITVVQDSTPIFPDQLTLNKDSIKVTQLAANTTVQLQSNRSWTITNPVSWVSITPMNGSNNATLNISIQANGTTSARTTNIIVTAGSVSKQIHILQDDAVGINELLESNQISIYPNPSSGMFTFENKGTDKCDVQVFDVNGKLLDSFICPANSIKLLNYNNINDGLYLVRVFGENGSIGKSKIFISK